MTCSRVRPRVRLGHRRGFVAVALSFTGAALACSAIAKPPGRVLGRRRFPRTHSSASWRAGEGERELVFSVHGHKRENAFVVVGGPLSAFLLSALVAQCVLGDNGRTDGKQRYGLTDAATAEWTLLLSCGK